VVRDELDAQRGASRSSGRQATRRDEFHRVSLRLSGYLTQHEQPNLCLRDIAQLSQEAEQALRRMRRRPTLVAAFWHQIGILLMSQYSGIRRSS
jgi:hypothetical protein